MKNAQRELLKKCMPELVEDPRTNKQKLWNDVIKFLQEKNCIWKNTEVSTSLCKRLPIHCGRLMANMMSLGDRAILFQQFLIVLSTIIDQNFRNIENIRKETCQVQY